MKRVRSSENGKVAGRLTITTVCDGQPVRKVGPYPNKVVMSEGYGRNLIARQLVGDTTYSLEIDSASLGDDDTPADDAQTALLNPLLEDIPITNAVAVGGSIAIDIFLSDANLPNDSYSEFGLFCDGRMFCRVVLASPFTKASGEDTVFTYELIIN